MDKPLISYEKKPFFVAGRNNGTTYHFNPDV